MVDRSDDLQGMKVNDPSGVMDQLMAFPDQLEWAKGLHVPDISGVENVAICGIGGSAIAGDVISDLISLECSVPVFTVRNIALPEFAGPGTLAVVVSYSGNTAESLNLYNDATRRGCQIIVVTSGGEMERLAIKDSHVLIKMPADNQPRASMGFMLGAISLVLAKAGISRSFDELMATASGLRAYQRTIGPDIPSSKNQAKKIARALQGEVSAIYSPRNVRCVAVRWQNQLNENSKMVAFSGEIPEMDHNQLVGWLEGGKGCHCVPVFLLPSYMHPTVRKMTEVTLQMFNERGLGPVMVTLPGKSMMENVLQGIALGDMVSYYLAVLKGVDPAPVVVIKEFKERISH